MRISSQTPNYLLFSHCWKTVMPTQALFSGMPEQKLLTPKLCLWVLLFLFLPGITMEAILEFCSYLFYWLTTWLWLVSFPLSITVEVAPWCPMGIQVLAVKCPYPVYASLPALFRALDAASNRKCNPDWQTLKEMYWLSNWKVQSCDGFKWSLIQKVTLGSQGSGLFISSLKGLASVELSSKPGFTGCCAPQPQ